MTNRKNQIYEEYWQYTAAKTDLNKSDFLNILRCCIDFFNKYGCNSSYESLQIELASLMNVTLPSVRKMINQLVKLGFLYPKMEGYRQEALEYSKAKTDKKRENLLSKIVYQFSNFNNSMEKPVHGQGQINFFLKTLEEVGSINVKELTALMCVNTEDYPKGFLTYGELQSIFQKATNQGFVARKYNQISHLKNLLSKLDDIKEHDGILYFKTDAERLFGAEEEKNRIGRDSYLQRVYKSELEYESIQCYNTERPKCMVEGISYPILIASHIKPYQYSEQDEAFDSNNGLLLSRNIDSLFDLGYITFDDNGNITPSSILPNDVKDYTANLRLHKSFLNNKRLQYLQYHREHIFDKRYALSYIKRYNQI